MSATDSTILQVNFKTPAGTLINLYGDSREEIGGLIDYFHGNVLAKVLSAEQAILSGGVVASGLPLAAPQAQPVSPMPTVQAPSDWTVQQPPAVAAPVAPVAQLPQSQHTCDHGFNMKMIPAGVNKSTGKPYNAFYACPLDRDQQCKKRVYLN